MCLALCVAGGVMVLAETFDHSTFRQSLARLLATGQDGLLDQGFDATLEVALPKVQSYNDTCFFRLFSLSTQAETVHRFAAW